MTISVSQFLNTLTHTWLTSAVSCTSESLQSSFSRFLMSGLAALMSIFKLEVGVQGSQESIDLLSPTFLGVVRGPMAAFFLLFADVSTVLELLWGAYTFISFRSKEKTLQLVRWS